MGEQDFSADLTTDIFPFKVGEEFVITPVIFGGIEIVFFYERGVDLTGFNQGEEYFVPTLDIRNPSQFSMTNRNMNEEMSDPEVIEGLKERSSNLEIYEYLNQLKGSKGLKPVDSTVIGKTAYHAGGLFFTTPLRDLIHRPINKIEGMRQKGIYGREDGVTYFSVDFNTALVHGKGSENSPERHGLGHPRTRLLLLTIDVAKLASKRNIFADPESLRITDEFRKNFVVHSGIPVSAITRLDVLQFRGMRATQK